MSSEKQRVNETAEWPAQPMGLGDYALLEQIGSGGGGARVFRARHVRMDRIVAVKTLPPSAVHDSDVVERFHREVKTAAKLIHPNIVTAFDAGEQHGIFYLVMEFVDGQPLTDVIEKQGPLSLEVALDYILQAACGLEYAHSLDVVHRDIKPSNLMLDIKGTVKILDMGLARVHGSAIVDEPLPKAIIADAASPADGLTQVGQLLGTVGFMSPEQARDGSLADHRTDIYALGCTLYYLLTGHLVYQGDLLQTVLAHAQQPIPRLRDVRGDVPEQLETAFRRMLAKDPQDRYQTMSAVITDLEQCAHMPVVKPAAETVPTVDMPWRVTSSPHETVRLDASKIDTRKATIPAIGIDFGTVSSVIAYLDDSGRPAPVANSEGSSVTPSAILLRGKELAIGERAVKESLVDREHVADWLKCYLGQRKLPRPLGGTNYPPEALVALMLKRLVDDARAKVGEFDYVVIAVPACFDEVRRNAIQDAGYMAGLYVADVINEPTALAVALAHQQGYLSQKGEVIAPQTLLILDLGAGMFDVSVLRIEGATIRVLSTAGDDQLGGYQWDNRLVDFVAQSLQPKFGVDLRTEPSYEARLRQQCEQVKRELTTNTQAVIAVSWQGRNARAAIPRSYFEELTRDLVARLRSATDEAIRSAGLEAEAIDRVILAGGASAMPAVRAMLRDLLGPETKVATVAKGAVAHGAALYAARRLTEMRREPPRYKLEEISSYSLGLVGTNRKTGRPCNRVVIARNTKLPATMKCTVKTQKAGQQSLALQLVRGEAESLQACTPIGKWVLKDLPPDLPAGSPLVITIHYAESGRITLLAELFEGNQRFTRLLEPESGLSRDELDRWRDWVEMTHLCHIGATSAKG